MALDNATILGQLWLQGSNDFQQRIPQPTKSNMADVADAIFGYQPAYNEAAEALVNLIGNIIIRSDDWANGLGVLKRDGLLPFGATIEEVAFDLIKATAYDLDDSNFWENNKSDVYSAFHTLNSQLKYTITVFPDELRKAFNSTTGLSDFVTAKLNVVSKSAEYDEYRQMVQLIAIAYAEDGGLVREKVTFVDPKNPTEAELKTLSRKVRETAKRFTLVPTTRYNRKGVPAVSRKEDLVLITTPEVTAALDVNVLADAFNIDRTDFVERVIEIDEFPVPGVYAMLVDRNWFIAGDTVRQMESFRNPGNLGINFFLHKWSIFSVSPFMNAVAFGEDDTTVTPVVELTLTGISAEVQDEDGLEVTTVDAGGEYKLFVEATATTDPETAFLVAPSEYTVSISSSSPLNSKTHVSEFGTVRIQDNAIPGSLITIVVSSAYIDPSTGLSSTISDTILLTVFDPEEEDLGEGEPTEGE